MNHNFEFGEFDELACMRVVQLLCSTGVRQSLTVERVKQWVKQFQSPAEKTLARLILRNMIFRTTDQLMSSIRQALKQTTTHFVEQQGNKGNVAWGDALKGGTGLNIFCGPPSLPSRGYVSPGKSGELVARLVNQRHRIDKCFPSEITVLKPDERFIVVDDGTYTGVQLCNFLRSWDIDFSTGRVAIAVSMAHQTATKTLKEQFPDVPIYFGELLTPEMCFASLCQKWVKTGQWRYDNASPLEVYVDIHQRNQKFDKEYGAGGYGDIGALVAFEHGIPDDSIQLLWDISPTWQPLVNRGT